MGGSGHPFTPLIHISGYAHDLGPNFPEFEPLTEKPDDARLWILISFIHHKLEDETTAYNVDNRKSNNRLPIGLLSYSTYRRRFPHSCYIL